MKGIGKKRWWFTALLVTTGLLGIAMALAVKITEERNAARYRATIENLASDIEPDFENAIHCLEGGATVRAVRDTVTGRMKSDNPDVLEVLETIRAALNVSLVYVMNKDGLTVACTPYGQGGKKSLTGKNYAFRPYFTKVMSTGKPYVYGGLGVTTGKRGFYVGAPLFSVNGKEPIGVIVAKIGLERVDTLLSKYDDPCALLTGDGIVFASNQTDWLYKAAYPLDDLQRKRIRKSRQFAAQPLLPLGISLKGDKAIIKGITYQSTNKYVIRSDWRLYFFAPYTFVDGVVFAQSLAFGVVAICILFLVTAYIHHRRVNARELLARERELYEREAWLRAITESAQDAIVAMSPGGGISFWNPAAERIFGYNKTEVTGKNLHELLTAERYRTVQEKALGQFQKTGQGDALGRTLELEARHKNGYEIPVELSLSSFEQEDGWHAVGIVRDITERKRAENEIRQMNKYLTQQSEFANEMAAKAEMANKAKSEFLANMSHEIRTPMNGVIGMTGLLLDTHLTSEQRRYAEIVRASADSLLELINDILDFSKIEAGKLEIETMEFDLGALLDDFAEIMALKAHEKGLEFICAVEPDMPTLLRGDPGRLRQVLVNLAGNAVKFTREGEIAVHAALESGTDEEAVVRFSVRDTGIGIPEDRQRDLFQQFTQVDASTTRKYGGTGLGLAISKQLAEAMGGEIGLESEEGQGTEFWFTARFLKQPGGERNLAPPVDISGVHILVVDDNVTNREILMAVLKAWKMRPDEAAGGNAALIRLREAANTNDPYQVAILDMRMPGMDGEELGRAIKADPVLADTSMVMMTSLGERGGAERFREMGFSAYLTKPVRQSELYEALAAVVAGETHKAEQLTVTRHSICDIRNKNVHILLAEDNIINQQVSLGILKKLGLSADAVANGAEAVKALEATPYDLVLMDCQMPEMDGYEATRRIRNTDKESGAQSSIPIIALTANAIQGDREKCLEAGMNDYLSKPVHPQALADILNKWLPRDEGEDKNDHETLNINHGKPNEKNKGELAHLIPVFDKAAMLERLMGDEELVKTVIDGFLEDIPCQIEMLKGYLEADDVSGVERQAHTIKGASANVGGETLRQVAFEIEKAGKAGDIIAARDRMAALTKEFGRLKEVMEAGV